MLPQIADVISDFLAELIVVIVLAIGGWLLRRFLRRLWNTVVGRLAKQWRYLVVIILLILIEAALYLVYAGWWIIAFSIAHLALVVFAILLLVPRRLWTTRFYGDEPSHHEEFLEGFQHGLENWEYTGGWRTEREGNRHILIVTDSGMGGIAKPCHSWTDYMFEFETKIVHRNTSWIIRAKDTLNYVMLQCGQDRIYPHFLVGGQWTKLDWTKQNPVILPVTLPLNAWFGVRIEVRGMQVMVTVKVNGRRWEILNSSKLLEPPTAPVSYSMGSVGFRESDVECAHFRNVRVKRL